jgi:anaerobic magnesium-protoporphyrin IX monomethyl ester cyclase
MLCNYCVLYNTITVKAKENTKNIFLVAPKFNWMHGDIPYPPLAASYLSAVTNEIGIKTTLADGTFPQEYEQRIADLCQIHEPVLVGISSTFLQMNEGLQVARRIKQANPEAMVVMGGAGPNCIPQKTFFEAANGAVDIVSVGESEYTWKEIVETFMGYQGKRERILDAFVGVRGTVLKGAEPVNNPPRGFVKDLDTLPMPDLEVINAKRYIETWRKNGGVGSISIFPSRGCPFSCIFCDKTIFGKIFRVHSKERIVNEMERLVTRYGPIEDIFFFDDNLTTDKRLMQAVCQEILDRRLNVGWSCQARINTVDEETLRIMKAAGCTGVFFGLESTSPHLLKYLNKGINLDQARMVIDLCKKVGIRPGLFLMTGIPGETEADAQAMENFVLETKPSYIGFSVLLPFPGTQLYQQTKDMIRPELALSPEMINDPSKIKQWDDTRNSIYQKGTFETQPTTTIDRIESVFRTMLIEEGIHHDPSQFVIER